MKKILLLLLLSVKMIYAQDYKELKKEDILIVRNERTGKNAITVLKKDSTALPTGYYSAPFEKTNSTLSFYVAPNGKLNKTAKYVKGDVHSDINLKDGLIDGALNVYEKNVLIKESIFKNGMELSTKTYEGKNHTDELFDESGKKVSEKIFDNGILIVDRQYKGEKTIEKQYKNGQLISSDDETTGISLDYENGKLSQSKAISKNGDLVEQYFDKNQKMIMEKTTFKSNGHELVKNFSPTAKLLSTEEYDGNKLIKKQYDSNGKITKTSTENVGTIMIQN